MCCAVDKPGADTNLINKMCQRNLDTHSDKENGLFLSDLVFFFDIIKKPAERYTDSLKLLA